MAKLPGLAQALGGGETWCGDADPSTRFAALLASGLREGRELQAAWARMQLEAQEAALWLGEVVEGPLAERIEGAGQAQVGTFRKELVEHREKVRGKLLLRALEEEVHISKSGIGRHRVRLCLSRDTNFVQVKAGR